MNELIKFHQSLMQEVIAMQSGDEDGTSFHSHLPRDAGRGGRNRRYTSCL